MAIMGSSSQNSNQLFDELRNTWVADTPEERVRQKTLAKLIHVLHFPKACIVVEKELKELPPIYGPISSPPQRRVDILCYAQGLHPEYPLYPLLLIECKAQTIDVRAADQLIGYNSYVRACFIALVSEEEERFGYREGAHYVFQSGLPSFKDLLSWIKS